MKTIFANRSIISLTTLLLSLCFFTSVVNATTEIESYQSQLKAIDKAHQIFSNKFYNQLLKNSALKAPRYSTIETLFLAVKNEQNNNDPIRSIALIINNKSLLTRYYDSPETITLLQLLLDNNAFEQAKSIMSDINDQGDDNVSRQLHYLLADFSFQRKDWHAVLNYLADDNSDLPLAQYHHSLLIKGIALQQQGEHSNSIKVYQKIPKSAQYYTAAQINMALANIRQGWWTDGHHILSQLLTDQQNEAQEQALNRLYITLGYSLLNQSYYRNARKNFQLVGLDSRYNNQALLGIALTAAHQDDYLGALNAARFLKAKQQDDLPIDEAFLLVPFFYEKSQQLDTASLGYSQAASYYQDKILSLNKLINSPIELTTYPVEQTQGASINIKGTLLDLSAVYPDYFFTQRQLIIQLKALQKSSGSLADEQLTKGLAALNQQYDELTVQMAKSIMQHRVAQLSSYLNQSRYGLARLFDNNTVEQ
jgi:hypothetical protein